MTTTHPPAHRRARVGAWRRTTRRRGSHVVEFVIITPVVLLIVGVMIAAGHIALAHQKVQHAAVEAARAASIARPAVTAAAPAARAAGEQEMIAKGLVCTSKSINTDVSTVSLDPGTPAYVRVEITCDLDLGVLAIPGINGFRHISASAISPVDTYRERVR